MKKILESIRHFLGTSKLVKKAFSIIAVFFIVVVFSTFFVNLASSAKSLMPPGLLDVLSQFQDTISPKSSNPTVPKCDKNGCCPGSGGTCKPETEKPAEPPADTSKIQEDRCFLIAPGMSNIVGNVYGAKGVKAFNDPHPYKSEVDKSVPFPCAPGTGAVAGQGIAAPENPLPPDVLPKTPRFSAILEDDFERDEDIWCHWALDYAGNIASKTESSTNFEIRKKQKDLIGKSVKYNMFSVTMTTDFENLTDNAKEAIHIGDEVCPSKSNQYCDQKEAGEKAIQAQPAGPSPKQHEEYWATGSSSAPPDFAYNLPPPGGDPIKMQPKFCVISIDKEPTCTSADVDAKDVPLSGAGGKSLSSLKPNDMDVAVSKSCEFTKSTATPPEAPDPNENPLKPKEDPKKDEKDKPKEDPKGNQNNPPGGGQQSPPGGGGGQNPQGGQQQQQQTPTPNPYYSHTPTPTPGIACPQTYAPVCDVNGQTQANRCIAEQQKHVQVVSEGECTINGVIVCPQTYMPVCDINNKTQPNQCVAEKQKKVEIKHTGACTSTDGIGTADNAAALIELIQQVVTSGIPQNTITSVVESILKLYTGLTTSSGSSVPVS